MTRRRNMLITGASRGFGLALARHYLYGGWNVCVVARDKKVLKESIYKCTASAAQDIIIEKLNVSKEKDIKKLAKKIKKEWGHLDVLINNAGVYGPKGGIEDVNFVDKNIKVSPFFFYLLG